MSDGFFQQLFDRDTQFSVIVEDDGRVGYAYLLKGKDIISDVWIYNRCASPIVPEWKKGPPTRPYANAAEFVLPEAVPSFDPESEIAARWEKDDEGNIIRVDLYLQGNRYARLKPNQKPGWARLAKKDGPLAKSLGDEVQ